MRPARQFTVHDFDLGHFWPTSSTKTARIIREAVPERWPDDNRRRDILANASDTGPDLWRARFILDQPNRPGPTRAAVIAIGLTSDRDCPQIRIRAGQARGD